MPKFQVQINGQNFLVELEGEIKKYGFFTSRYVEAIDAESAENEAVEIIRRTERLRELVRNAPDDPPMMVVTEIIELESFDEIENLEPGFVWYEEDPKP